ncbi:MAG: hypothetical protein LQ348_007754 [Seirophora lacunosa]|nr:MAG: hypothetical protein LQ348_007754 [Seirophora lacunosa]
MRLPLYIHAVALLQLLLHISGAAIPQHASGNPYMALTAPDDIRAFTTKRSWPDHRHHFFTITSAVGLTFLLRFNVLELVYPNGALGAVAARDLVEFYKATFAVAKVLWTHSPPTTMRTARMNGILLLFRSDTPIEWDFLQGFFEHIIDRTYGGLVGGFDVTCVAEVGNAIIHVSLSLPTDRGVPQAARAARLSMT